MSGVKTICRQCRHFINNASWYGQFCTAVENDKEQDPITGEFQYVAKNDLGRVYFHLNRYAYARDINHGNCEYFTALNEKNRPHQMNDRAG